jgi:hypothetical protein
MNIGQFCSSVFIPYLNFKKNQNVKNQEFSVLHKSVSFQKKFVLLSFKFPI